MTEIDPTKVQRNYKFRCYPHSVQRQQLAVEFGRKLQSIVLLALIATGCGNHITRPSAPIPTDPAPAQNVYAEDTKESVPSPVVDIYAPHPSEPTANVMQTGRYQLVPLEVDTGQRNLLKQLITIDLPPTVDLTVQRGIEHALTHTGLSLCQKNSRADAFAAPLPVVHKTIGPTTLGRALQVLAGPAWRLRVNFARRTVCFARRRPSQETQK